MEQTLSTFFVAWSALAAAAISPGPNMVAVASRGLGAGQASALTVAIGIAFGGFFGAVLTSVGLGIVFETVPLLPRLMGVIGGAYLLWLGFNGWRSVLRGTPSDIAAASGRGFWRDAQFGLMVTATNPKVALLWISLSTFVSAVNASFGMLLVFASVSSLVLFVIYGGYGLVFSLGGVRRLYAQYQKLSDALFGNVFTMLGIGMILRALI